MTGRPAAGGGRRVEVAPERLGRWLAGFARRHGEPAASLAGSHLVLRAPDGAVADLEPSPGMTVAGSADLARFVAAANTPRRLGLLLARRGAVAVGVAEGDRLTTTKVDTHYVQGRTAAGGWSQQRFARRRENQAKAGVTAAVEVAARVLLPQAGSLAALVTGGDRRTVEAILADPGLSALATVRADRLLDVREPRQAVLRSALAAARAVRIVVRDPDEATGRA